jgi:predicted TIM-barrel fold metal-dependent hydrolase
MRIIDFHTHAFADDIAARAIPALEAEADTRAFGDGTIGGLVASMDAAGIAVSVLQPVATKPGQVRAINDWAASVASDRIVPFGAMHPSVDDPAAEIAHMAAIGLRGIKLHPEYQEFVPDEERMAPIYEAARAHGLIVLFHAGIDIGIPTLRGTPRTFAQVLAGFPGLKVVLAHMGSFKLWDEVTEELVGREVWLDTAYTLGHLPDDRFVEIARAHGTGRIVFGTDAPWTDAVAELAHIRRLGFDEGELAAILGGNAEVLLAR